MTFVRTRTAVLALALVATIFIVGLAPAEAAAHYNWRNRGWTVYNISHRGYTTRRIGENTRDSIVNAYRHSADMAELDTRETADHQAVLMHDPTLNRTTNCGGAVNQHSAAQITRSCHAKRNAAEHVITVEQAAAIAKPYLGGGRKLMLEEKPPTGGIPTSATYQQHMLNAINIAGAGNVIIESYEPADLAAVQRMAPTVQRYLISNHSVTPPAMATGVIVPYSSASSVYVRTMHQRGITVIGWGYKSKASMRASIYHGIDGEINDSPVMYNQMVSRLPR